MCPDTDMPLHMCTLKTLNLSHNKFGDSGAMALAEALKENTSVAELDLSYNSIRSKGGIALFSALESANVATLDLGYNAIGESGDKTGGGKVGKVVSECLASNDTLIHLSLSHAGLGKEECDVIGQGLKSNTTLMGLHLEGNSGSVDAHGYVVGREDGGAQQRQEVEEEEAKQVDHVFTRILPWAHPKVSNTGTSWTMQGGKCWICDRWSETKFTFDPSRSRGAKGIVSPEGGLITTNFDEWTFER